MEKTKRIAKWDNIRLLLMFCVILGHIDNYVGLDADNMNRVYMFIYAFHMPAFIFISGLFCKNAIKNKRFDKAFTFLALYFVIKFSMFFMRLALGKEDTFRLFNTDGVEWYALAIFIFYIITMLIQNFDGRYVVIAAIFFGCMAGYDLRLGGNWVLNRATAFYPFFALGFYLDIKKTEEFCGKIWVKLTGAAVLIAAAIAAANLYDDLEWIIILFKGYAYRNLSDDLFYWGGLIRLACYAIAILMTLAVISLIPSARGFWSTIGSRTLSIYAFHFPMIMWLCTGFGWKKRMLKHMTDGQVTTAMIIMALIIMLVLSLKPIYAFVRLLTVPPLRKTQKENIDRDEQATKPLDAQSRRTSPKASQEYGTYEETMKMEDNK